MPDTQNLRTPFRLAYGLGALLCVVLPLLLQGLIGNVLRPGFLGPTELAQDLGYTFTGLVTLCALYVVRRSKRVLQQFAQVEARKRGRVMALEILRYSALLELSALFGWIYLGMGGPEASRYARSFIALSPIMFLIFVPRLPAWNKALSAEVEA